MEADSDLYRMLLLPLIALAVLPFPYVPEMLKVFFLALIIFGFTCYDAITWGDLADEISDRQLPVYASYAPPTIGNFAGISSGGRSGRCCTPGWERRGLTPVTPSSPSSS
ncbi:MAG TPA: hypothetical protein OIL86_08675 [Eggerthellaceae bacterium]|nr:hypothetical protein [Eggerthellaceae bacterium]